MSHWTRHSRKCQGCRSGRPCERGRTILRGINRRLVVTA